MKNKKKANLQHVFLHSFIYLFIIRINKMHELVYIIIIIIINDKLLFLYFLFLFLIANLNFSIY